MDQETTEEDFQFFSVEVESGDTGGETKNSLLRVPHALPKRFHEDALSSDQVFNILMADASGSMKDRWSDVVRGWQKYIVNHLTGRSKVYIFDTLVRLMRNDKVLLEKDFTGYSTNLTAAFETIRQDISNCQESHVNVFLITDGQHNFQEKTASPETEIQQMAPPPGKTVCVYVLGIGNEFPVGYSIDIRSYLHNGNSNVPTLFWAKYDLEILEKFSAIGAELTSKPVIFDLNIDGYIIPGLNETKHIHLGEWIYFPQAPEDLSPLTFKVNNKDPETLTQKPQEIQIQDLINQVFRQWNSILIQQHRKGAHVPYKAFDLMDSMFNCAMNKLKRSMEGNGVKSRIHSKLAKTFNTEYATLKNQSKRVIDLHHQYDDELQLAEAVLKTTVTNRKYDQKNLQLKGHGQEDFEEDVKDFKKIYEAARGRILGLPIPPDDDCCRLTHTSILKDLQDPDFPMMLQLDKFNLLKTLSMTGIPAFAPIRDASQINPWTIAIRHILGSPYDILSQRALEAFAEGNLDDLDSKDKSVLADKNNERTRFNIIIPLVPADAAKVLKPLVCSKLYAMLSTFCIMKNPHIIDYNAHLAALASAWIINIRNFPADQRPEFITRRLESIVATANLYMSRPSVKTYLDALTSDPDQAVMTESTREFDGHTVKCESLVKPMFFLYMRKQRLSEQEKETMLKILLAEFIGRCLPNCAEYANNAKYTEFFARDINSPKKKQTWLENTMQSLLRDLQGTHSSSLLDAFYTLDELHSAIKKSFRENFLNLSSQLACGNFIAIDMAKIKELRNVGSCGDVRTSDFKIWAQEMGVSVAKIKKAASPKMVSVYACEALHCPNSRDRLSKAVMPEEEAMATIKHQVMLESARSLKVELLEKVNGYALTKWREEYAHAHRDLVMPLAQDEVVRMAEERGINVDHDTFKQVYRYNDRLQLLRNACQMPKCPHYLMPRNNFNQHLSVEREQENFPHALHVVSKAFSTKGVDYVAKELSKGNHTGTKYRKRPRPPKPAILEPLREQLSVLLDRYTENE